MIKSYKCKFCSQIFEEYDQLKIHIRDIHLKPDENGIIEVPINIPKLREESKNFLPLFYQTDSKIEIEPEEHTNGNKTVFVEVKQEFNVEKVPKKNIRQKTTHKKSKILTKQRSNRKKYQSENDQQVSKKENPVALKCEECQKVFKEPWILKQHQSVYFRKFCKPPKIENEETEFLNCSSCLFIARTLKGLKAHALNDHFQCYDCNLNFENREDILNHLECIHLQKWICTICNTRYFTGK